MTDTGDVGLIEKPENKASRYGTWLECFHRRHSGLTDFRERIIALYGPVAIFRCFYVPGRLTVPRLECTGLLALEEFVEDKSMGNGR